MHVYVYQAALLCEPCASRLVQTLPEPAFEVLKEDSDTWPQGPYSDGGGESDSPQHCDKCGVFLENPLTADGVAYVREQCNKGTGEAVSQWAEFYADAIREEA